MEKILRIFLVVLLLMNVSLFRAQDIQVESFELDENDLTANIAGSIVLDQNGQKCALIKVETIQTGFSFDAGSLSVVQTEQKVGEIWVYVQEGTKRLTISHPEMKPLKDYDLGQTLKRAKTYVMTLKTPEVVTVVKKERTSQFVVFQVTPKNAKVELNGKQLKIINGVATEKLNFGTYDYRVEASDFLPEVGKVTIDDAKNKKMVEVKLKADPNASKLFFNLKGNGFVMKRVDGGTFTMGPVLEVVRNSLGHKRYDIILQAHQVTLPSYYIGETMVTQSLWEMVMGENPSNYKGSNIPVDRVSWAQCQEFVTKLSALTGRNFRLPTEAEWEYAARGGNKSKGYKYSGSDNMDEVGWYDDNFSEFLRKNGLYLIEGPDVKTKKPNELGLYDMSGYYPEFCWVWNGSSVGTRYVVRGGSIDKECDVEECRVNVRGEINETVGLRLAMDSETGELAPSNTIQVPASSTNPPKEDNKQSRRTVTVGKVSFTMVHVEGGTFMMGATSEQGSDANDDENPAHQVTLSPYFIGETEVTQSLWEEVMGRNPSSNFKVAKRPVENVSWDDCQDFIRKLNQKTGLNFSLPTEAEWEFAARGGNKSQGYKYIGSNTLDEVAWYSNNSEGISRNVKSKKANELGLYDMSGNVWEWCQDWYSNYVSSSQTNPTGPSSGSLRVARGGSWHSSSGDCRVSNRDNDTPDRRISNLGLRLVLH